MKQSYQIFAAALLASMSLAAAAQADDMADCQLVQTSQAVQAQRSTAMQADACRLSGIRRCSTVMWTGGCVLLVNGGAMTMATMALQVAKAVP